MDWATFGGGIFTCLLGTMLWTTVIREQHKRQTEERLDAQERQLGQEIEAAYLRGCRDGHRAEQHWQALREGDEVPPPALSWAAELTEF